MDYYLSVSGSLYMNILLPVRFNLVFAMLLLYHSETKVPNFYFLVGVCGLIMRRIASYSCI
jgi:hypothetical protein